METILELFTQPLQPVNVGLEVFKTSLETQGVPPVDVDWRPPVTGYQPLSHTRDGVAIDAANAEAVRRITAGRPMLVAMGVARNTIRGYHDRLICHSGPPITWDRMSGPTRGAVMGAILYEGWAETPDAAAALAASDTIDFSPCHHVHATGPMAGIISPSMPVFVIENAEFGTTAYATQNEGLGKVLRYGAYGPDVVARLRWMADTLYPALQRALAQRGPVDLRSMIAQALHMGDECHNRNKAGTSLFLRAIGPALAETSDATTAAAVMRFIDGNDHFFLNLSMPAMKAMLLPAENIPGCTVVTTMARNGTDFGIRVSATGDRWFVCESGDPIGLFFPGFTQADANKDIGDSTITETGGIGGFALAGAPAIVQFVGGTPGDATNATMEMYEITAGEHSAFTIPALNFRGTPVGIDVRKVMATGITPRINTGIAHKEPGIGMVGAGLLSAPLACFREAFAVLATQ